jgi:hypothetical protein
MSMSPADAEARTTAVAQERRLAVVLMVGAAIKLVYTAKNGRQVGVWHTPDYFVIRSEAIGWEEWKTEARLERLAETMPHRYVRDEVGRWRCPPAESFAEPFGLFYRLRSSAEIDWVFQRNLRLLEDYLES